MRRTGLLVAALVVFAVGAPRAGGTKLDSVAPAIVSSIPSSPANENNPTLNGTAEPGSLVFLYASGGCVLDFVGTAFADASGDFHIAVTVEDNTATTFFAAAAAIGPCSNGFTYVEDSIAPAPPAITGPPSPSGSATARFVFTSEPGARFLCQLDGGGGTYSSCSNPQVFTVGGGPHTLVVEAVDAAGNVGKPSPPYAWTVDLAPPQSADRTPPQSVSRLRRDIGYGVLRLRWKSPGDADFDHVRVFVSTKASSPPRTLVYTGKRPLYTNKRFKNGVCHRYLVVSYDHADNPSLGARAVVPTSALLRSPRNGLIVHSPPVLRWAGVRNATFYNVQLYSRGRKILSAWPAKPRRALARRWVFAGRSVSLKGGTYVWYVWPAFGSKARSHYGQLLGQGTFRVR
jgi:hypothetical protein